MLKPEDTDDIGITTNNTADSAPDNTALNPPQERSALVSFFVSVWTRIKFLFTNALAEFCDCSVASKNRLSSFDSTKGLEDGIESSSPTCSRNLLNKSLTADTEPSKSNLPNKTLIAEAKTDHHIYLKESPAPPTTEEIPLLRESSRNLDDSYERVSTADVVLEENLEPVVLSDEGLYSTAITFAHPTMFANVAPQSHLSHLLQAAEKTAIVPPEEPVLMEEVVESGEDPIGSACSSLSTVESDSDCPHTVTTLSRLQNQLRQGDITQDQYESLASSVIASTIPRNLSDSDEIRKTRGANKLYVWQIPPPLPKQHPIVETTVENSQGLEEVDSGVFVDSVIASAIKRLSGDSDTTDVDVSDANSACNEGISGVTESASCLNLPRPTDIYDGGFQTLSLDRVRGSTLAKCADAGRSKRSSSLKSERSPEGTPSRKIVRFADSLGLDLVSVRQVKDQDNPPVIPASATLDLNLDTEKSFSSLGAKQYQLCFAQPGASPSFLQRVLNSFVSLENARVESSRGLLMGTIRVKSLGFEKKVTVRITYDSWSTFFEIPASYVQDSYDGITDRFSFTAVFPSSMVANDKAQFAIRYETHTGITFWDNNYGENYTITCYAKATDIAGDGSWIHYL